MTERERDSDVEITRQHAPKLRALRVLERRQLSAAGETRLQKHLVGCDVCQRAQLGLRLADHLIEEARGSDQSFDFSRIEAGIARQLNEGRRRTWQLGVALPLAAAAAFGLWFAWQRSEPANRPSLAQQSESKPTPALERPAPPASLTALAGPATLARGREHEEPARIDSALQEGDVLRLGEDSLAHLRVDAASGCVVHPGSEVSLVRTRNGETEIELRSGRITSRVQKLGESERFVVRAGRYRVSVHGTHFEVASATDALSVVVSEGRVTVEDATDGHLIATLKARDHFAVDDALGMRLATRDPSQPALALDQPRGLGVPLEEWPLVTLHDVQALESLGLTALTIDGSRFPVSGELAVRVPRGDVTLIVERLTVTPQKIVLHVPADGLSLAPDALKKLITRQQQPKPAAAQPPSTPPADIDFQPVLSVVRSGTPNLQRCYERALKQRPDIDGHITLRLSVGPRGQVRDTQPLGSSPVLPEELVACLRTVSGQWRFPATGSTLTFDVPLRLMPR